MMRAVPYVAPNFNLNRAVANPPEICGNRGVGIGRTSGIVWTYFITWAATIPIGETRQGSGISS